MEELALESGERGAHPAIRLVAGYRVADRDQVHADLVHASGFRLHRKERMILQPFENTVFRNRMAAAARPPAGTALQGVGCEASDGNSNGAMALPRPTRHKRKVSFFNPPFLEKLLEALKRFLGSRHHHHARCIFIESVHDARSHSRVVPHPFHFRVFLYEPVGDGFFPGGRTAPAGRTGRMRGNSSRFIQDYKILLLV